MISQLFCLNGKIQKENLMITHAKRQQLFDIMVSFVFCLGLGYCLLPKILQPELSCLQTEQNFLQAKNDLPMKSPCG